MQTQMVNGNALPMPGAPDQDMTEFDQNLSGKIGREPLAKKVKENYLDMYRQAEKEQIEFYELLDNESPACAVELRDGESHSAIGSVAEHLGVVLRDDPDRNVYSTRLKYIMDDPAKAMVLKSCSKLNVINKTRKPFSRKKFHEHQLAFGIGDFSQGSAMNPYNALPLVDGTRLSVFPPISAIIANVRVVPIGGTFLIPEYKSPSGQANDESPEEWEPGTPIPLGRVNAVQTQKTPKWWAGGFMLTNELRNSAYGADYVMYRSDKEATKLAQQVVKDGLVEAFTGAPAQDIDLDATTITTQQVIDIAMAFNADEEDYIITTLFGRTATVKKYLNIDRSKLYNNSTSASTSGGVVGGDMYGKAGVNRMVYDVATTKQDIGADQLLGIDASECVDLHIQAGSEEETETYVSRTRVNEFAYTIKYLANLCVPDSGKPRKLFT